MGYEQLRTPQWQEQQQKDIGTKLDQTLQVLHINKPLEAMTTLFEKKKAGFVLETVAAAYGLNLNPDINREIVHGFYPHLSDGLKGTMTINHASLAAAMHGSGVHTAVKYIPVLSGEHEIGQISPLQVSKGKNGYKASMSVGATTWNTDIIFQQPASHATNLFQGTQGDFLGKTYMDSCVVGKNGGATMVDTTKSCEQGCDYCDYNQAHVMQDKKSIQDFKLMLTYFAQNTGKLDACFSAGSALSPDHGVVALFEPMLQAVVETQKAYPEFKANIELELMPWQKSENASVIAMVKKYHDMGIIKAINVNPETPIGVDRSQTMKTAQYGKANIPIIGEGKNGEDQSYLDTFVQLKQNVPDLQMAGLILYGLKPKEMDYVTYTKLCLNTVELFAQHNIKLLLQPVKITSGSKMADYPLVDPFWLTGSVLMADKIHMEYGLDKKPKVGCVNGCDACDSSRSGYSLLNYVGKEFGAAGVQALLQPWSHAQ